MHTFQTPLPVRLTVDIPKGRITVTAEETGSTRIELIPTRDDPASRELIETAEVVQTGDEIRVRVRRPGGMLWGMGGGVEARIHAPSGSAATLSVGSGGIETVGRLGAVKAVSGSGVVRLGETREASVRTGSGDIVVASSEGSVEATAGSGRIAVGRVAANVRITTGSGHAELSEAVGEARLTTGSGNIDIDQAGDSVEAFAASGNIQIRRADHGRLRAKTISGRVSVGVARGSAALLDISTVSGRVESELEPGDAPSVGEKRLDLTVSMVSGRVSLARV